MCALATSTTGQNARNSKPGQILTQVLSPYGVYLLFVPTNLKKITPRPEKVHIMIKDYSTQIIIVLTY